MELGEQRCPVCLVANLEAWEWACSDCQRAKYAADGSIQKSELVRRYESVCCVISGVRALYRPWAPGPVPARDDASPQSGVTTTLPQLPRVAGRD